MKLYHHQLKAIEKATLNNGNVALFHEPGLGKTRSALEIFKYYKRQNPHLKMLVVCPLSLINSAWGVDIKKFSTYKYIPFKQLKNDIPDITSINFESMISKKYLPLIKHLINEYEYMCVIDESSKLKNHKSKITKTMLDLAPYFKYRIIASGTPMPNSELELWAQIKFIQEDLFHKSFYAFRNIYFNLSRGIETIAFQGQYVNRKVMQDFFRKGFKYVIRPNAREKIMELIEPVTHWVKKEEALDLPDKVIQIREIILNVDERKHYKNMKDYLVTEIKGQDIIAPVVLTKMMKLRQMTSGFVYNGQGEAHPISKSSKMKELAQVLEELGNRQVIIWAQFKQEVKVITEFLGKTYGSDSFGTLYSQTEDKDQTIKDFQDNKIQYLVAHPKSAAHGLTFVNCSNMIFYSLDYSYESHQQAMDRIHRIGQHKNCLYIYFIAKNTIDEELYQVINNKASLQDIVYNLIKGK